MQGLLEGLLHGRLVSSCLRPESFAPQEVILVLEYTTTHRGVSAILMQRYKKEITS